MALSLNFKIIFKCFFYEKMTVNGLFVRPPRFINVKLIRVSNQLITEGYNLETISGLH